MPVLRVGLNGPSSSSGGPCPPYGEPSMLSIPGRPGANCDGFSRRELLRVGGAGLLGVSLANLLRMEAMAGEVTQVAGPKGKGFGKAKNFIFVFLQGGPSHLDIWDPKP